MKVRELIEMLQQMPDICEVKLQYGYGHCEIEELSRVSYTSDTKPDVVVIHAKREESEF